MIIWELGYIDYTFNKISTTKKKGKLNPKIHKKN